MAVAFRVRHEQTYGDNTTQKVNPRRCQAPGFMAWSTAMPPTSATLSGTSGRATRLDWDALRSCLKFRAEELIPQWYPYAKRVGTEYCVGNVSGDAGESLKINPGKGCWKDFAGDEKDQGDLITLYARLNGITDTEAGQRLWRELGLNGSAPQIYKPSRQAKPSKTRGANVTAPASDTSWHWALRCAGPRNRDTGDPPAAHWIYHAADGSLAMVVLRFNVPTPDKPDAKYFSPFSPRLQADGSIKWQYKDPDGPLPLYHLDKIPAASVLVVCEGEKAADAAQLLLPQGWLAITSAHGAKSAAKTDWTPVRGKRVVIWRDNDTAGLDYAKAVLQEISHVG